MFGIRPLGIKLNKELLNDIAKKTGGQFFYAKNPNDMRNLQIVSKMPKSYANTFFPTKMKEHSYFYFFQCFD